MVDESISRYGALLSILWFFIDQVSDFFSKLLLNC